MRRLLLLLATVLVLAVSACGGSDSTDDGPGAAQFNNDDPTDDSVEDPDGPAPDNDTSSTSTTEDASEHSSGNGEDDGATTAAEVAVEEAVDQSGEHGSGWDYTFDTSRADLAAASFACAYHHHVPNEGAEGLAARLRPIISDGLHAKLLNLSFGMGDAQRREAAHIETVVYEDWRFEGQNLDPEGRGAEQAWVSTCFVWEFQAGSDSKLVGGEPQPAEMIVYVNAVPDGFQIVDYVPVFEPSEDPET